MSKFHRMLRQAVKAYKQEGGTIELAKDFEKLDVNKALQRATRSAKKEKQRRELETIHETLAEHGVPDKLSKEAHTVLHTHSEPGAKEAIGGALQDAITHKKAGSLSEENLSKIVKEAVSEHTKGGSKEETEAWIREVLKSELQKSAAMATYYPPRDAITVREELERDKKEKPEERILATLPMDDLEIPMPTIKEGGMIRNKPGAIMSTQGEDLTHVNVTYPLTYHKGKVHVYANIKYDPRANGLLYRVIEPQLTDNEKKVLQKIETALIEELEVDFTSLRKQSAESYLDKKIKEVIEYYHIPTTPRTTELLRYFIYRDFIGLGDIEPLIQDPNIEDISCDGMKIPIYIYHRDPRYASVRTNIQFEDEQKLDSFVMKLAQRCNRSINVADPLLDGALPDGSRVQATFGSGISMKGSNFTIRKFTKDPLTCIDLMNYGTVDAEMLAYLWIAIEHGKSILVAGPTASGKTTMLNALSLFIRPELKIVSIEDTPELRLPHENWVPQVARSGFGPETASGKKMGEISLFDLLKASLRQRPDAIIVGEVRGKEAYVLFQQIATGHAGMSTIHAESLEGVISRLRTPPIELPPSLVQHLDMLMVLTRQRIKGKYMRRTQEIVEIMGYDLTKDRPKVNQAYNWAAAKDEYMYTGKSAILRNVMNVIGATRENLFEELARRERILLWMQERGIRDFKNVGRVIAEYYQNPTAVLEKIHEI